MGSVSSVGSVGSVDLLKAEEEKADDENGFRRRKSFYFYFSGCKTELLLLTACWLDRLPDG